MTNNFAKLKTIPFPKPIEALTVLLNTDLYVAMIPSDVHHFDLCTHKMAPASSALNLDDKENITGIHPYSCSGSTTNMTFFVSTHTCALYNIVSDSKSKSMSVRNQVGMMSPTL